MIAAHDRRDILARPIGHRIRIRPIPDQIAQAQNAVVLPFGVGQHRFERLEIGVNIAENQMRHRVTSATSGGAPRRAGNPMVPMPRDTKIDAEPCRYNPSTYGVKKRAMLMF